MLLFYPVFDIILNGKMKSVVFFSGGNMNKKFDLLKNAKYIVLAVFALLAVLSLIFMGMVGTNYNISDYLDDSTDTKISLGIMDKEFGLTSNIQVMVDDVSPEEAEEIKNKLKAVENVTFVNFNSQSTDYYKEGTALFVLLVDGNEYSDTAIAALDDVRELMDRDYAGRVNYGGMVTEKTQLREVMQKEIFLILLISICLVAVLMLITASSWIEPLVLLAAAGVAVLLNMGSNIIFGEISYITKAVAAILQLALSMDYSIVLLHTYRAKKKVESDNDHAMLMAIKEVVKPVSASALTTMAGLLALLFMSFTIGFDIGIVLMKSIVVSAISAVTLLPAMLLLFDKLMQKTAKKPLEVRGDMFVKISLKAGKFIVPVAAVLIIVCCILSGKNTYTFVDSCNKNENITDKFGDSGTLIVLYEKAEDSNEKEILLNKLLASYKTENGDPVLKSSVAYSSTVGQVFDVDKASKDLGISKKDAELLFTVYYFTQDETKIKLTVRDFADFAIDLIENDEDAQGFVSEDTVKALDSLMMLDSVLRNEFTSDEFSAKINECLALFIDENTENSSIKELLENEELKAYLVDHMYGLYFFDQISPSAIYLTDILSFLHTSELLPEDVAPQIDELINGIALLDELKTEVNYHEFKEFLNKNGVKPLDYELLFIWNSSLSKKIPIIDVLRGINAKYPALFPEELAPIVENYDEIYTSVHSSYEYDKLIPTVKSLVAKLGRQVDIDIDPQLVKQLYVMYFVKNDMVPNQKIGGMQLLEFMCETAKEFLGNQEILGLINLELTDAEREEMLSLLSGLPTDAKALTEFLGDTTLYDYKGITERINDLVGGIQSIKIDVSINDAAMMGVYVKYATNTEAYELGELSATTLLEFVLEAAENNPLLSERIDDSMRQVIRESQENIISAEKMLVSENYMRMLLTVNLPPESAESSRFVEYLSAKVNEIFGEGAYVAGEIATTYDLINAFDEDNRLISSFTVVSIFLIIMVVFGSLSLPVILVAVIQGAVWIAMSFTLISGGSMFFMSYIMAMCILMGATIDYGILLSTNYVNARATMDKREALNFALDAAMPTIFTSGLILMICGVVVGFVASQTSISSVGFLLFRGTLVSTVMITMVLPSLLYMLDKIVIKLTLKKSILEMIKSIKK